jgi:hypothetical protein
MNTLGTIKGTDTSKSYRQYVINCLGENDRRKYYLVTDFGTDFNVPENVKALTGDSKNKDDKFVFGFLNTLKTDDLNPGEKIVFSTSEDGSEIKTFIKLLNTGVMDINGDADFLAGFTKLKEGFDQLVSDVNDAIGVLNSIVDAFAAWTPVPNDGGAALKSQVASITDANETTASIDDSKKENLKCE